MTNFIFQILNFLILTNTISIINIAPRQYDYCMMSANFNTKDNRPIYGIRLQSLDINSNIINESWVQESYVPPMSETIPIFLTPDTYSIKCIIFGPDLTNKWNNGKIELGILIPKLYINISNNFAYLNWTDYYNNWTLEKQILSGWTNSYKIIPMEHFGLFRLKRKL